MAPIKRARSLREAAAARVLRFGVKRARRQRRRAHEAYKEWGIISKGKHRRPRKGKMGGSFDVRPDLAKQLASNDSYYRFQSSLARAERENLEIAAARGRFLRAKKAAKRTPKRYLKLARKIAGKRRNA